MQPITQGGGFLRRSRIVGSIYTYNMRVIDTDNCGYFITLSRTYYMGRVTQEKAELKDIICYAVSPEDPYRIPGIDY